MDFNAKLMIWSGSQLLNIIYEIPEYVINWIIATKILHTNLHYITKDLIQSYVWKSKISIILYIYNSWVNQ